MKNKLYKDVLLQIRSIIDLNCSKTGNLANIAACIYEQIPALNWVGYYLLEENKLKLNAFQGKVACTIIELNRGVCGKAARERKTIIVPDVHQFPDHIACDSASNSEIVIPIIKNNQLYGVFDIDSNQFDRFHEEEQHFLEEVVSIIEHII